MIEPRIINRGRGPEIEGTRITVYDVLDYLEEGWHRDMIACLFELSSQQVEVATRYIEDHREEVMADYQKIMERINRGNPPELQAKIGGGPERLLAMLRERRAVKEREARDAGHSGGH
jgi:uncharacterized protein (DUF433 family)